MGKFSKGSNSLSKKLGDLADKAEKLDETTLEFSQEDLFNDSFMNENTKFKCFNDFIESSPVDVQSQEDFDSLKNNESFNNFVRENTKFENWSDMVEHSSSILIGKMIFE
ncbi:TPA: hypothetical protein ACUI25_000810 [Staphylococcus aureus]